MSSPRTSFVAGRKRTTPEIVRELWRTRRTLWILIRRDLKVRYADSVLGYLWSVLEPLLMSIIYWFVFTVIFHRSVGEDPYIVFLLSGLLPWMWFTTGLTEGSKALRSQRRLIASTALPRQIWVLRSVGAMTVEFLFSVPVFVLFMLVYRPDFNLRLLLIPIGLVIQLTLLLGLGYLLAPITMLFRDTEPVIRLVNRALFYASPIIYSFDDVMGASMPGALKILYELNPVTGIMQCYRAGFFPVATNYQVIAIAAVIAAVTLAVGWFAFMRMERAVLKEI